MYEIRPETVKTFIMDRSVKLPRFQRKQTWDEKKNFQLCISIFKEYPIGVCILSIESSRDRSIRWLLDGRQRRNCLTLINEDPENIYNWGKRFIGFNNTDQPSELENQFWKRIFEYIEIDSNEEYEEIQPNNEETFVTENEKCINNGGLTFLLDILKIIHNKTSKGSGFTRPFDLSKYVNRLPYIESNNGKFKLSSKRLKTFLDEYTKYCDNEYLDYSKFESFIAFMNYRCDVKDSNSMNNYIKTNWIEMYRRIEMIERIDNLLSNSKIGMIEVKNLSPSDSQKIFNIINSEGEKLTAVEILSAKPSWNIKVDNPSQVIVDNVGALYKRIGTNVEDVVRWDLAATLISRLNQNVVIKKFSDSKSDFEKEITLGFKLLSGIYQQGVKKEDIESLSKNSKINWSVDIDNLIYELNQIIQLIESFDYFKYFNSWRTSIMDLTSDAIALNFIIVLYKDWVRKNKPIGNNTKTKQFQKNSFILFDKLIYEYINRIWRGSSDSRIANNIKNLEGEPDIFNPITKSKWENTLNEIYTSSTIEGNDISLKLMKPLLYHFYSLSKIQGPDTSYSIEIDHIIPQSLFTQSAIERNGVIKDNILNLGLLPKDENISKSNKRLVEIHQQWLKDQIKKYEFIEEEDYVYYSNVNNYGDVFNSRKEYFNNAFLLCRDDIINN